MDLWHHGDKSLQHRQMPGGRPPLVLVVAGHLNAETWNSNPWRERLDGAFEVRLADSPDRALELSREIRSSGERVALILSDVLSNGSEVIRFITAINRDWPAACIHLFDAVEGRVIFSEPPDSDSGQPSAIRIESNCHETLDSRLVLKMIEHYFPGTLTDGP